jgi:hypothetical protein
MGTVHARVKDGVIYPEQKVNDGDVTIHIEKRKKVKIHSSHDIVERLASKDIEEIV